MTRRFPPAVLLLPVFLTTLGWDARAQTAVGPRALAPGVKVEIDGGDRTNAPSTASVDETALRYYAKIGDVAKMEAEIQRLRSIDPSWSPPKDLFSPRAAAAGFDDTPIWALVSAGKYAEARAAAAEARKADAAWEPSPKLAAELDAGEATARVKAATDGKRWREAVDAADATPSVLICDRLDIMWRTAEALGQLKETDRAFDLYKRIVTTCPKAQNRRDTVFKAKPFLSPDQLRQLAEAAKTNQAPGEDYSAVGKLIDDMGFGRSVAKLAPDAAKPSPSDVADIAKTAEGKRDAGAAAAIGWYYHRDKKYAEALDWFRRSNEWSPSEEAVAGMVYALLSMKKLPEAREAAKLWPQPSEAIQKALVAATPKPVPPGAKKAGGSGIEASVYQALSGAVGAKDWGGCLSIIDGEAKAGRRAAAMEQQRGWCLLELLRPTEARVAFEAAGGLVDKEAAKDRDRLREASLFGAMIARVRLEDVDDVLRDLPDSPLTPEHRQTVRADALGVMALRFYRDKRFKDTLRFLDARAEIAPEPRTYILMRAWSLYNLGRSKEALEVITSLDTRFSDEESRHARETITKY